MGKKLFESGDIYLSRGIALKQDSSENFGEFVFKSIRRHLTGDWGDLLPEDIESNNFSLNNSGRLVSMYKQGKEKIYIITEMDRASTTILFPEEY